MPPVKKIVLWLVVIFLIYAILTAPDEAADMVNAVWDFIVSAAASIAEFFDSLINE